MCDWGIRGFNPCGPTPIGTFISYTHFMPEISTDGLPDLEIHPVTPQRWDDFEALFGPKGALAGCWCMWWRIKRKQWEKQQGLGNKRAMKEIVKSGEIPGLIAYVGERPAGWCSVAPREHFPVLDRSPVLKPVDDLPVWSVVCFYIHKDYRRKGLARALLRAAMEFAQEWGAQILEGYPIEPKKDDVPGIYAFTGFSGLFEEMGFKEVARRSEKRPIMRYVFKKDS